LPAQLGANTLGPGHAIKRLAKKKRYSSHTHPWVLQQMRIIYNEYSYLETTRNLIGNGIFTLLRNPDALVELRSDDGLWPAAVEELLRYESPVQAFSRGVTAELEVEGTRLPAGSSIVFMIGAAHRDARQYADPDRLDLRRPHNRHLAFGGDAHVCLGSTLARLEGRLSMRAVTRRFPNLRLVDEKADWGTNFGFRGLNTLRVQL